MVHLKTATNFIKTKIANIFPAIGLMTGIFLTAYFAIALFIFWVKNAAVILSRWAKAKKLKTVANALFPIGLKIMSILSKK